MFRISSVLFYAGLLISRVTTLPQCPDYLLPFGQGARGGITAFAWPLVVTLSMTLTLARYIHSLARY
jgi:hypothetical protein